MRGNDEQQGVVFSYVSAGQRIAADHPLRQIRTMTDAALRELSPEFDALYAPVGPARPSYVAKTALISASSITSPGSSCFWPPSTTISFTLIFTLFSEAAMK
jgi:hypothetical protein